MTITSFKQETCTRKIIPDMFCSPTATTGKFVSLIKLNKYKLPIFRTSWIRDKSTLILFAVLILPVVIFCVSYMTLFGVYEKTVFPITRTSGIQFNSIQLKFKVTLH